MSDTPQNTVNILITRQGPMVVEGVAELRAADGCLIDTSGELRLCRCGNSRNKPFCDKTHERIEWMDGLTLSSEK